METQTETTGGGWTRERVDLIKRTVCPKGITDDEFALFAEQCQRSGLDPLLKEAFCVPRRQNIGNRDRPNWVTKHEFQPSETGMLARAERFPDYRGVQASAVFAEDEIFIDAGKGEVSHRFNPAKRKGPIVGAWARVERRDKVPVVVWVDFEGYAQATPLWSKIPTTMIEKVSRVAALRKAYPEAFGGLYVREEMPAEEFPETEARPALPAQTAPRVDVRASRPQPVEAQVVDEGRLERVRQETARQQSAPAHPPGYTSTQETVARVAAAVHGEVVETRPALPVALGFGPCKGMPIRELTDDQLSEAMDLAHEKLAESPKARWAAAMRENLAALEADVDRRVAEKRKAEGLPRQPGEEG